MKEKLLNSVEHKGFIDRITVSSVFVKILSESACSACHAKGACTVSEMQEKEVEVSYSGNEFSTGDVVTLVMEQSQGFTALLIGYVSPFFMVFCGLLIFSAAGLPELSSGILAIGLLIPYYFVVYLFRKNIRRNFTFSIRKSD